MYSEHLSPYPTGWYKVAYSDELPPGKVLTVGLCGGEIVLFRTAQGEAAAFDPYCTHLGAHFGHGGSVVGETLQCPFHGFCFDTKGVCVQTGYGTKAPPKAVVKTHPVRETHGIVFVWHDDAGRAPAWTIPDVDTAGWTSIRRRAIRMKSHVQEIAENSVDIGHLVWIHKYDNVRTISELKTEGAFLNARYGMTRPRKVFGQDKGIDTEFEIFQYGLGYARVEVDVVSLGIRTRQFVLCRPLNEDEVELSIGMSIQRIASPAKINPLLAVVPKGWLTERIADASIGEFHADVMQDFPVWNHKKYVTPPALAQGDGPVGAYRRWAKQFYGADVGVGGLGV